MPRPALPSRIVAGLAAALTLGCGSEPSGPTPVEFGSFELSLSGDFQEEIRGAAVLTNRATATFLELRASPPGAPFDFSMFVVIIPPGHPALGEFEVLPQDGTEIPDRSVFATITIVTDGNIIHGFTSVDGMITVTESNPSQVVGDVEIDASASTELEVPPIDLAASGRFNARVR